jgi:hypothetical protein
MQFPYLEHHATPLELACLAFILDGKIPSKWVIESLFIDQNPDGGWPARWSQRISSLDATCFHIALAEQLGLTTIEMRLQAALRFLAVHQSLDGSWDESQSLVQWAPQYLKPGVLESRLYLTANCGFWLAHFNGRNNTVPRAMGFLMRYLEENGCLPSSPPANFLSAGLWLRMRRTEVADKVITACKDHLAELSSSNLGWMGVTLIIGHIRQKASVIQETAYRLLKLRKPDNYWESENGSRWNCHTTIQALRVLKFTKNL